MKHVKKFETLAIFEAAKETLNRPNVSLIKETYEVNYLPNIAPVSAHEYIEIGGIKWATMNIGASSVTDYGLYFQWGDTQGYTVEQVTGSSTPHKGFTWEDYKFGGDEEGGQTKYNDTDEKAVLDAEDDAVTAAWGGNWRMPTVAEYAALGAAVNTAWTADYQGSGISGMVCTDKTDSSKVLFFPTAGCCSNDGTGDVDSRGYYWSSSISGGAWARYASLDSSGYVDWQDEQYRNLGFSVRGILDE